MIQAVVFGIRGIFVSDQELASAGILRTSQTLEDLGFDAASYRAEALVRYQVSGVTSLFSRTYTSKSTPLPALQKCELNLLMGSTSPEVELRQGARETLAVIGAQTQLAFMDHADPQLLETLFRSWKLSTITSKTLWTQQLGRQARPPSILGFRWLEKRLKVPPENCLYIGTTRNAVEAAEKAGWQIWPISCSSGYETWNRIGRWARDQL